MVPGMGGAMDLVTGARRVIVAMTHAARGQPKLVVSCTLPLTSERPVDLIVTELAVLKPAGKGFRIVELMEGISFEQVRAATSAKLLLE